MNCGDPDCKIECHHPRKETGPGWAKCLDCGAGYGWPGILPDPVVDPGPPGVVLPFNEGDILILTEINETV